MSNFVVYHACSAEGYHENLINDAPFCSAPTREHWLAEGYYFWRGAGHARKWGKKNYVCENFDYAILKAKISFEGEELLDLLTNPDHIDFFNQIISRFMNLMARKLGKKYDPTVSEVIEYYRKSQFKGKQLKVFPYKAILAAEGKDYKYKFVNYPDRENMIALNREIQMCLFKEYRNKIEDKELIYPTN